MNLNYVGSDPLEAGAYAFAGHSQDLTGFPPTYIENAEFNDLRPAVGRDLRGHS